jgi:dihydrofolate reductase
MPRLRVHNFAMSLDGYAAGPNQSRDDPLGVGGTRLHEWAFASKAWNEMQGLDGGQPSPDDRFVVEGFTGLGATVMGRNMFGPIRGDWDDDQWTGWWGDDPPYHHPVFVLTHHRHDPIPMQGGTTFYFVTDGIESALEQALAAAGGQDVRLGGGVATVQQYMHAGLLDELHIAVVPILLGSGERLFDHLGAAGDRYECAELVASPSVVHVRMVKRS